MIDGETTDIGDLMELPQPTSYLPQHYQLKPVQSFVTNWVTAAWEDMQVDEHISKEELLVFLQDGLLQGLLCTRKSKKKSEANREKKAL
ncbi:5020_t:CDS:2 [Paraglomus occultum]|uniref:5020_t:CDS:1 n=1 Tax=Paraglomus occultum TaxID=144539 RepID=A0A9N9AYD7_9GLOM|nr:5020_t:CDS:2 [Paraglomus occultum]